jgi:hypothetical protein
MAKGTALSRALAFFREEQDMDVVRVAFARVTEIVSERLAGPATRQVVKRARKPKPMTATAGAVAGAKEHESLASA